jgi:hypothetical protein
MDAKAKSPAVMPEPLGQRFLPDADVMLYLQQGSNAEDQDGQVVGTDGN